MLILKIIVLGALVCYLIANGKPLPCAALYAVAGILFDLPSLLQENNLRQNCCWSHWWQRFSASA